MKVAYIVSRISEKYDGVNKKIFNTVMKWNELGIDAKLFIIVHESYNAPKELINNEIVEFIRYKNNKEFYFSRDLLSKVRDYNPSLCYVRGIVTHYPSSFSEFIKDKIPCVQEIHTNDVYEIKNLLVKGFKSFNLNDLRWTATYLLKRNKILKQCTAFVLLNHELSSIIPSGKKYTVIGDGINLKQYPIWDIKESYDIKGYNVIFMGTANYPWYGLDKLLYISRNFPECTFHMVGMKEEDMCDYDNIPKNIRFYGFLNQAEYEDIIKKMDVAIGSLSLHVNKMSEGSPLKGREYLAYGLPTIIGYKDTDFMDKAPNFILELPSTVGNVKDNLEEIKQFIQKSKKMRIKRDDIAHLDYELKERKRIEFFQELVKIK